MVFNFPFLRYTFDHGRIRVTKKLIARLTFNQNSSSYIMKKFYLYPPVDTSHYGTHNCRWVE